jgi:hypothetical protein
MIEEYTTYPLNELIEFFKRIKEHRSSYLFLQNIEEIINQLPGYLEVVRQPIDLNKIESKMLESKYNTLEEFKEDIILMFNNCKM